MSVVMVEPMAKKKAKSNEPELSARKPMVVQIRGSEEWKAWVEDIADREGFTVAMLFERAIRKLAKDGGYPDPPRR